MAPGKKKSGKGASYQGSLDDAEREMDDSVLDDEGEREVMLDAFGEPVEFDEDDYGDDESFSSRPIPRKETKSTGKLEEKIAVLNEENRLLQDRVMRTMAEMENLRQRTKREKADTAKYAVSQFAGDMLGVSDNLQRALEHVDRDRLGDNAELKTLFEGVEMTERELDKVMERHGIVRLMPEGQRFDPNLHQAMFEVPNPDVEDRTVVQVIQAGYVIGDRLLRSAMVGVSTGGPKPVKAEAASEEGTADSEPVVSGDPAATTPESPTES